MPKMMENIDGIRMLEMNGKENTEGDKLLINVKMSHEDNHSSSILMIPVTNGEVVRSNEIVAKNDSMTESEREKMGSTPENIKKIDDQYHANNNSFGSYSSSTGVISDDAVLEFLISQMDSSVDGLTTSALSTETKDVNNLQAESVNKVIISDIENESLNSSSNDGVALNLLNKDSSNKNKNTKLSCAFTIDHFEGGKKPDYNAQAAKYKIMLARFQNRHRRSLPRLENTDTMAATNEHLQSYDRKKCIDGDKKKPTELYQLTMVQSRPPCIKKLPAIKKSNSNNVTCDTNLNEMKPTRVRGRSVSSTRNLSQRHSWSPRSSAHENDNGYSFHQQQNLNQFREIQQIVPNLSNNNIAKESKIPSTVPRGRTDLLANPCHNRFISRSTAMQSGLKDVNNSCSILRGEMCDDNTESVKPIDKVITVAHNYNSGYDFEYDPDLNLNFGFECNDAPIQACNSNVNIDCTIPDTVSESGTYIIDGDNYTEEEKDLMNIDRSGDYAITMESRQMLINRFLQMNSVNSENNLVNNYHADTPEIPESYSHSYCSDNNCIHCESQRVFSTSDEDWTKDSSDVIFIPLNHHGSTINDLSNKTYITPRHNSILSKFSVDNDYLLDFGMVTSVSANGILAKQRTMDPCPKPPNNSILCKTQIDCSEYVSSAAKFKHSVIHEKGGHLNLDSAVTDHQKVCYGMNAFGCVPDETSLVQKRHTKRDWVLEWARKTRARSLSRSNINSGSNIIYNGPCEDGINSSPITIKNRNHSFNILHDVYDSEHNSASTSQCKETTRSTSAFEIPFEGNNSCCGNSVLGVTAYEEKRRPLQTLFTRKFDDYVAVNDCNDRYNNDNDYLHHTESAIFTLQRNIANQNFVQSPTLSLSTSPQIAAPTNSDNLSYIYSIQNNSSFNEQQQKRNCGRDSSLLLSSSSSSLLQGGSSPCMTSSINEQQLQLLTSGDYIQRQMQHHQRRKSSLEGDRQVWFGDNCSSSLQHRRLPHVSSTMLNSQQTTLSKSPTTFLKRNDDNNLELSQSNLVNCRVICRSNSFSVHLKSNADPTYVSCNAPESTPISVEPAPNSTKKVASSPRYIQELMSAVQNSPSNNNFDQICCTLDDNEFHIPHTDEIETNNSDFINVYGGEMGARVERCKRNDSLMRGHEKDATAFYLNINNGGNESMQYYRQFQKNINDDNAEENCTDYDNSHQCHHYKPEDSQPPERPSLLLSNTRYNKALLMRIQRSKQRVNSISGGSVACPNTPEFNRRNDIQNNSTRNHLHNSSLRQSTSRNSSLNRLAQQVPKSLASAKKQLLKTAATVVPRSGSANQQLQRGPQSRYLNISKYKSSQTNQFLRKDTSKSTLKATSVGVNNTGGGDGPTRTDVLRSITRSPRSLSAVNTNWKNGVNNTNISPYSGSNSSGQTNRSQSANRRDLSVSKQKEIELALWKRRSKYDPMKAAAEDRKRKEEAKRLAQIPNDFINEKLSSDLQNRLVVTQSDLEEWSLIAENDGNIYENTEHQINHCNVHDDNDNISMADDLD